jgi:hypothetical protein
MEADAQVSNILFPVNRQGGCERILIWLDTHLSHLVSHHALHKSMCCDMCMTLPCDAREAVPHKYCLTIDCYMNNYKS